MNSGMNLAGFSAAAIPTDLQPGDIIPRAMYLSEAGEPFDLGLDDVAGAPLVLLLCRSTTLSLADEALSSAAAVHDDLVALGARVFAITPATAEENVEARRRLGLPFEFLSDPESSLLQAAVSPTGTTIEGAVSALIVRSNAHVMRIFEDLRPNLNSCHHNNI